MFKLRHPRSCIQGEVAKEKGKVLEIGPFFSPVASGDNVEYFDVMDQKALIARAASLGNDWSNVPFIKYVSPVGDLSIVEEKFDAVISSHCIEHQPDMVRHLSCVTSILRPSGKYFLIVPDKRYCFDHFLPASNIADVVGAHLEGRKVHTASDVIEHRALHTHNNPWKHWAGFHGLLSGVRNSADRIKRAIGEWEAAKGGYVDVHAWQFTPESFAGIIALLKELGLISLEVEALFETRPGELEFGAILSRPSD